MMDHSVEYIGLVMRLPSLQGIREYELPEGFGFRFYRPGDREAWTRIETSAGEFDRAEEGAEAFRRYYPDETQLPGRMLFLMKGGTPFATATAWYGDAGPRDPEGRLHWVAIDAEYQGRGLSRPLVSLALSRMRALGHRSAYLTTQTTSWVACKVYADFGFRPAVREPREIEGWRIVSEKSGIDFMQYIDGNMRG